MVESINHFLDFMCCDNVRLITTKTTNNPPAFNKKFLHSRR